MRNELCTGKSFPSCQGLKSTVDYLKFPFIYRHVFCFGGIWLFNRVSVTCGWGQRSIALLSQQLSILCVEAESQPGVHRFIRLAGQPAQGPSCLLLPWGLNLHHHACTAGAFPAEPSLPSHFAIFYHVWDWMQDLSVCMLGQGSTTQFRAVVVLSIFCWLILVWKYLEHW